MLVIRELRHKMTWEMLVPKKGTEFPGLRRERRCSLTRLGTTGLDSDATRTMQSKHWRGKLKRLVKMEARPFPKRQPVGESQSNGITERTVALVAGQARTLKPALEHRIGTKVPAGCEGCCAGWWSSPRT